MITIYGIRNCDTMKKAMKWLDANSIVYTFHDYKKSGIDTTTLSSWADALSWEVLVNKRGTTWRQLDDKTKEATHEKNVAALLCEHPAMIKRPILKQNKSLTLGFSKDNYDKLFR